MKPGELETGVILAFAAGFVSEVFLKGIRTLTDGIVKEGVPKYIPRIPSSINNESETTVDNISKAALTPGPKETNLDSVSIGETVKLMKNAGIFLAGALGAC